MPSFTWFLTPFPTCLSYFVHNLIFALFCPLSSLCTLHISGWILFSLINFVLFPLPFEEASLMEQFTYQSSLSWCCGTPRDQQHILSGRSVTEPGTGTAVLLSDRLFGVITSLAIPWQPGLRWGRSSLAAPLGMHPSQSPKGSTNWPCKPEQIHKKPPWKGLCFICGRFSVWGIWV